MLSHTLAFIGGAAFAFSAFSFAVILAAIHNGSKYDDINDAPCIMCNRQRCICWDMNGSDL